MNSPIRYSRIALPLSILIGLAAACDEGTFDPSKRGGPGSGDVPPGGNGSEDGGKTSAKALLGASHGSTIALSNDDLRLVVANRDVGTATVFAIDYAAGATPTLQKLAEVPVGAEPSQVIVDAAGESAFVLSRKEQKLTRIDGLRGTPSRGPEARVGSEATGLAMTPMGTTLWVANWMDGTVTTVDAKTMQTITTIDLNTTLTASGMLGAVAPRPSLAHPRSIAITNNGDTEEKDETAYITEYWSQQKDQLLADGSNADTARVGVVYKVPLATMQASIIELPPIKDMGFHDHKDGVTGCFPNQLSSINIQGAFGYVTSVCASPKGPIGVFTGPANAVCTADTTCPGATAGSCVAGKCTTNCTTDAQCGANTGKCVANVCAGNVANVKTTSAPAVHILDLGGNKTIASVNLDKEFDSLYGKLGTPDDGTRRMPLLPMDVAFVPGTVTAYFPANGADAVFRVDFNATYDASTIDGVGDPKGPFLNLVPPGVDPSRVGKLPTGIVMAHKTHGPRFAFVANEATRNVSVLDIDGHEVAGASDGLPDVAASSAMPTDPAVADALEGKRLFNTGLGRWSLKGQAWMACQSCHVDGLTDNITWFFARGPRQPNSLDGTFASNDKTDMRAHNWNAINDEITDHEGGALRNTAGALGAIVKDTALSVDNRIPFDKMGHAGLAGSASAVADPTNPLGLNPACVTTDWQKIAAYIQSIRTPRRPSNLDEARVKAGADLFAAGACQGCHGGAKWTTSRVFYTPDGTNALNKQLSTTSWATAATTSGFPSSLFPAITPAAQTMRYAGPAAADFDQLTCMVRPVGSFGVAEPGVGIAELRRDMVTPGQGNETDGKGYNPPSLLGPGAGAPYLHAGNARTLEALFSAPFDAHTRALRPQFLPDTDADRKARVAELVQYLLAIDEDLPALPIPVLGPDGGSLCKTP
jgi:YVTN family beta-propeller protein